jgi:hypothetical protein
MSLEQTFSSYTRLKERAMNKPLDTENGIPVMTLHTLRQLCIQRGGYETPELNDTLYLHFNGFTRIGEAISAYYGAKSIFMESNGITKIENLEALTNLTSLFLQKNRVKVIENLDSLQGTKALHTLSRKIDSFGAM